MKKVYVVKQTSGSCRLKDTYFHYFSTLEKANNYLIKKMQDIIGYRGVDDCCGDMETYNYDREKYLLNTVDKTKPIDWEFEDYSWWVDVEDVD